MNFWHRLTIAWRAITDFTLKPIPLFSKPTGEWVEDPLSPGNKVRTFRPTNSVKARKELDVMTSDGCYLTISRNSCHFWIRNTEAGKRHWYHIRIPGKYSEDMLDVVKEMSCEYDCLEGVDVYFRDRRYFDQYATHLKNS